MRIHLTLIRPVPALRITRCLSLILKHLHEWALLRFMEAETGPIGGDISHGFIIILAETERVGVFFHKDWLKTDLLAEINYDDDLQPFVDRFTSTYARADENTDP